MTGMDDDVHGAAVLRVLQAAQQFTLATEHPKGPLSPVQLRLLTALIAAQRTLAVIEARLSAHGHPKPTTGRHVAELLAKLDEPEDEERLFSLE